MRKIRIFEHISLDGVIEPGGPAKTATTRMADGRHRIEVRPGWRPSLEAQGTGFDLLLGRRTYDLWAGFSPKAGTVRWRTSERRDEIRRDPPAGQPRMGASQDLGADILEGVRGLKSKDGPDLIVWGSSTLTSVLLGQGLVDEVVLIVYPVLLGRGKRFFSDRADPRELAFVSTKATSDGRAHEHVSTRWIAANRMNLMPPNHALQRTRPSRSGCNRTPSWAGSLSLGR